MKDRVIMRISGPEVNIFFGLDPRLKEFVTVVKGKKVLYVDNDKISHVKLEVVQDIIGKIKAKFGKMTNKYGGEHEFLGMKISYKDDKVEISMKKHILKAIDMFMEDINREATLPAKAYLFDVREVAKDLKGPIDLKRIIG
ncbi:unnamed protein product [Cylindrotheca closterium]|uniref:Uncharacterized protein n=1 Tax=Cylindrotheca closterium TaxID=2856 RepID=A0AAD2JP40_9STRA|nr:unnamed protein product [Cylindrotheca closterium]